MNKTMCFTESSGGPMSVLLTAMVCYHQEQPFPEEAVFTPRVVGRLESLQDCDGNHLFFGMDWPSFITDKWGQGSSYSVKGTLSLFLSDTLQNRGSWWLEDSSERPFIFQGVTWAKYNAEGAAITDTSRTPLWTLLYGDDWSHWTGDRWL